MDINIEKLREELKNKIDEVIDSFIYSDNELLEVSEDKIYMEFNIDDQDYIAFAEDLNNSEEIEMLFAKVDFVEGKKILRNIESLSEYELAKKVFNKRLELISN